MKLNTMKIAGLALAATVIGSVATAATVTISSGDLSAGGNIVAPTASANYLEITPPPATLPKQYRSPYGDASDVPYAAIQIDGFAMYTAGGRTYSQLSLDWGSIDDAHNFIDFYMGDDMWTVSGADVNAAIGGVDGITSKRITLKTASFDKVVFRNTTENAFEYGDIAAVPLPAGILLLGGALAGLGLARRRK